MIFISHRGNLNGVNPERENSPEYIDEAIAYGFDVEVDLRVRDGILYLGHDECQYEVSPKWLYERVGELWIHAKDFGAVDWHSRSIVNHKYFCHESDRSTLTSNRLIWCHDLSNKMSRKCIIPLLSLDQVNEFNQTEFYAVCSDYVFDCQRKFK